MTQLPTAERVASFMALDSVKQFGPQKFRELHDAGLTPQAVVADSSKLPTSGKRGDSFRKDIASFDSTAMAKFVRLARLAIDRATENDASILLIGDPDYPTNLWASNNAVPILYVRGDVSILTMRQSVACVGSREIQAPYGERQAEFAGYAARTGRVVVSGFALGADTIAHRAACDAGGRTICVMPCGLDRVFPPENRQLREQLLQYPGAVFVSEFPFATGARAMTLRKRNKTIVALSRGVVVGQSSTKGGAMNAYRFALEQRKPVATFAGNGSSSTSGNQQIADTVGGTTFPTEQPDQQAWEAWLAAL